MLATHPESFGNRIVTKVPILFFSPGLSKIIWYVQQIATYFI